MKSFHIVGYTFNADVYCPDHIIDALPTEEGQAYDGWALAPGARRMTTEQNLDEIAFAFGIERENEVSFDSGDFPKVIFADQASDETCAVCDYPLVES